MAKFGISVLRTKSIPGAIKLLRVHTSKPIGELKKRIENKEIIELFDTCDYEIGEEFSDHQKMIEEKLTELSESKFEARLHYRASPNFRWEEIDLDMMRNLITSSIEYRNQDHD